jgi:hypothetical protein
MSDEQRKDEEAEVEGHVRKHGNNMNEEPSDEAEAEADDDVEAHVRKAHSARMDNTRHH